MWHSYPQYFNISEPISASVNCHSYIIYPDFFFLKCVVFFPCFSLQWLQGDGAVVEWGEATSSRRGDNCSGFVQIVELYSLFVFKLSSLDWICWILFAVLFFASGYFNFIFL